jgi:hypothetical protein
VKIASRLREPHQTDHNEIGSLAPTQERRNLTSQEQEQAFATLLATSVDGKLPKGTISGVAATF